MLVLTKKVIESIYNGDDLVIHVLGIKGNQAKIGISVPRYIQLTVKKYIKKLKMNNRQREEAFFNIGEPHFL